MTPALGGLTMVVPMQDYEKLVVWKHAHRGAVNVQRVTARIARFLQIAAGSAAEPHYHVRFATDAALIPRPAGETPLAETTRVRKMLFVLIRRVPGTAPHSLHPPTAQNPQQETRHGEPPTDDA